MDTTTTASVVTTVATHSSTDWYTLIAIALGPILAVQASEWLQRVRAGKERKVRIFKTLMSTRAANLYYQHVEALNLISIEFYGKNEEDKAVRAAWKAYHDHLNTTIASNEVWYKKRVELLVDLLHTMAIRLGYDFDKTDIKNDAYLPSGYGELEDEQRKLRQYALEALDGKRALSFNLPEKIDKTSSVERPQ